MFSKFSCMVVAIPVIHICEWCTLDSGGWGGVGHIHACLHVPLAPPLSCESLTPQSGAAWMKQKHLSLYLLNRVI